MAKNTISTESLYGKELEIVSEFLPLQGEANFGPTILKEVRGGVHISPEVIVTHEGKFVMVHWPKGLPRHESVTTTRFAHGLMRFGETVHQCCARLVKNQFCAEIKSSRVLEIDSYVDPEGHWHIEPWFHVELSESAKPPPESSEIVTFRKSEPLPKYSVWTKEQWEKLLREHF